MACGLVVASQSCGDDDGRTTASGLDGAISQVIDSAIADRDADDAGVEGDAEITRDADTLDGTFLAPGAACADAGRDCVPGYRCCAPCCIAGSEPVCQRDFAGTCPLPDLVVDPSSLVAATSLETIEAGTCEAIEGCLGDGGLRRVLRFDVRIANRGAVDLVLGRPDAGAKGFFYAACHAHYHFDDFAQYSLKDDAGVAVVVGRKQAYCARDDQRVDGLARRTPQYDCNNQGISSGWADIYGAALPCQWLDVTDVPPGDYRLEVEVNPRGIITENNYSNNRASVPIKLP